LPCYHHGACGPTVSVGMNCCTLKHEDLDNSGANSSGFPPIHVISLNFLDVSSGFLRWAHCSENPRPVRINQRRDSMNQRGCRPGNGYLSSDCTNACFIPIERVVSAWTVWAATRFCRSWDGSHGGCLQGPRSQHRPLVAIKTISVEPKMERKSQEVLRAISA